MSHPPTYRVILPPGALEAEVRPPPPPFSTYLTSYRVLVIVLKRRQFSEDKKPIMHSKLAIVFVHYVHK